jgi:hypothetical protein
LLFAYRHCLVLHGFAEEDLCLSASLFVICL